MDKSKVLKAIMNYKEVYTDASDQVEKVKGNQALSNIGKREQIEKIQANAEARLQVAKESLASALRLMVEELKAERKKAVADNLNDADKIALVMDGISNKVYSRDMLEDIVDAFKDNLIARESIRLALTNSGDLEYNEVGNNIPKVNGINRVIQQIEKNMIGILESSPTISFTIANDDDWGSKLMLSGATFDSWYQYIEENI